MKASHKEHKLIVGFQEIQLNPGEFIFGLKAASKELRLTVQNLRTCISFLKDNKNITIKTTNKFSIISIVNWDTYQSLENENNTQINKPLTNDQQTTNKPLTTNKNVKNVKKRNIFIVPSFDEVQAYCLSRNNGINPQAFIDYYAARGWMLGKSKMKDWKAAVRTWESRNNVSEKKEAWEI